LSERYQRGLKKFIEVQGDVAKKELAALEEVSPDLARLLAEYAFGDVLSRPGLDIKTRELITIGMLSALGTAAPQLKGHIQTALDVGCTSEQIIEVIIQVTVYAGFPAALNAAELAREVFKTQ
jgi:4-carboxymuconolactone decarboxylase